MMLRWLPSARLGCFPAEREEQAVIAPAAELSFVSRCKDVGEYAGAPSIAAYGT